MTATATASEHAILITRADGTKVLRGLPNRGDPSDAVLAAEARAYGGITARVLGTIEGDPATTRITDVDYAADGTKVWTRTRAIGTACDCGKGDYCPQWGRLAAPEVTPA